MNLLFNVDQTQALRLGINAPSSTITLDVDPAQLTDIERTVIAAVMLRGHDCTRLGLQSEPESIIGQAHAIEGNSTTTYSNGRPTNPLILLRPNLEGLREAIKVMLAERGRMRAQRAVELAMKNEAADNLIEVALSAPDETIIVSVRENGELKTCFSELAVASTEITVPHIPYVGSVESGFGSEAARARYKQARDSAEAARKQAIEAARNELLAGPYREFIEHRNAQRAREKAEYDSVYARLHATLRARHEAGYATDEEVNNEIRRLVREEAGLPSIQEDWSDESRLETLTDAEFERLQSIQTAAHALGEDASVTPMRVWNENVRGAREDDDAEEINNGLVIEHTDERRVAVIDFRFGGLDIRAVQSLS